MADNDAIGQRVERVLLAQLRKQLHRRCIRPAHVRLGRGRVKVAPARAAGVDDARGLRHLDTDVGLVGAAPAVPRTQVVRQRVVVRAVALHKAVHAHALAVRLIRVISVCHDRRVGLRAADAMQHDALRMQRDSRLIAFVGRHDGLHDVDAHTITVPGCGLQNRRP